MTQSSSIIRDPSICHGKPIFKGTRILVTDILDQIAEGYSWDEIVREWQGSIDHEAIREAVSLATVAFEEVNPKTPAE